MLCAEWAEDRRARRGRGSHAICRRPPAAGRVSPCSSEVYRPQETKLTQRLRRLLVVDGTRPTDASVWWGFPPARRYGCGRRQWEGHRRVGKALLPFDSPALALHPTHTFPPRRHGHSTRRSVSGACGKTDRVSHSTRQVPFLAGETLWTRQVHETSALPLGAAARSEPPSQWRPSMKHPHRAHGLVFWPRSAPAGCYTSLSHADAIDAVVGHHA